MLGLGRHTLGRDTGRPASAWRARGPRIVVAIHTWLIVLTALVALWAPRWVVPDPPYDDVVPCFMCITGPLYVALDIWSRALVETDLRLLAPRLSPYWSGYLIIVAIPGLLCVIVGGMQWYLVSVVVVFFKRRISPNPLASGICERCGYDLRGNPAARACPECGTPIPPRPTPAPP